MLPNSKSVILQFAATSATNATATGAACDCRGFDFAIVDFYAGTSVTSETPTALTLKECDTTVATSFATFSGCVAGTDYTILAGGAAAVNLARFQVDLRGRMRYLAMSLTPGTNDQAFHVCANLFRADELPTSTTEVGASVLVNC